MKKRKIIKLAVGDIISILLEDGKYAFARVIAKMPLGDVIEIYDFFSDDQEDYLKAVQKTPLFYPIIIDAKAIFKISDKWEVIANIPNYSYVDKESIRFKYGVPGLYKVVDINGKEYPGMSQEETDQYPLYAIYLDSHAERRINFMRNKHE